MNNVMDELQINAERLLDNIKILANFGPSKTGGSNRQALTESDIAARKWLVKKALRLGFEIHTDTLANLFFKLQGKEDIPSVMSGSHMDTQPNGGHLDGCYGVLAAFECLQTLKEQKIVLQRPIEVVVWTNEEGCRFSPGAMGSSGFVEPDNISAYLSVQDANGTTVAQCIENFKKVLPNLAIRNTPRPYQFIELHIEQGPILEDAGIGLGIVSAIQGVQWFEVICHGRSAHAGTTPHEKRLDAVTLARNAMEKIERWVDDNVAVDKRLTFGRWQVFPNAINTIPCEVKFTIDFRHTDAEMVQRFHQELPSLLPQFCQAESLFFSAPIVFDSHLQNVLIDACKARKKLYMSLASGAFHDAMFLARCCPTGMLFVPSHNGISHNPQEYTEPQQMVDGANVLLTSLITLANER